MEITKKKCSLKKHNEIDAISYCHECKIYMCNKCINHHQELYENHHQLNLDKDIEVFIDICQEDNHPMKLAYYCKDHNQLCCVCCIAKVEGNGYGQHKDCNICFIENIKEEKKNALKENIKYLEDVSKNLDNQIKELKNIFEKINVYKEDLKLKVQNFFTKIRNALNEREDKLLLEIDNKYNDIFCNEDIIKECDKLPKKIKKSLDKGKLIDNDWNDNLILSSMINDCINIEKMIKNINIINEKIKKCNSNIEQKLEFEPNEEQIDNLMRTIKTFKILNDNKFDSLILKSEVDENKFKLLIQSQLKINEPKLLFRASRDQLNYLNVVNKINNKSNLIFLYFTGKKRIFGAFIKTKLDDIQDKKYYKDENAFVFSLDNNKIYKVLIPEKAIRFYTSVDLIGIGNTYESNGFYFSKDKSEYINDKKLLKTPKIYDFQKNEELTEGSNQLTEFEIFEIQN